MLLVLLGLSEVSLNTVALMGETEPFCNAEQYQLRTVFQHHLPQTPSLISTLSSPLCQQTISNSSLDKGSKFLGICM